MFMNLNGVNGDVVILVRVFPDGKTEQRFMNDIRKIADNLKITSLAVQLYSLFGWTKPNGDIYNQYEFDFKSEKDLMNALNWLNDYFFNLRIEDEDIFNEPGTDVLFARRMPIEESA